VTLRSSDAKSGTAIVVVGINFDSLEDNFLDNDNLALFCGVEEAILIIRYGDLRKLV
jgi:hypothetical protein